MASSGGKILRAVRQRPATSVGVVTATGIISSAFLVENQANRNEQLYVRASNGSNPNVLAPVPLLPREYDWDALNNYWELRPVTAVARVGEIGGEMLPLLARYVWDFKVLKLDCQDTMRDHAQQLRQSLTKLGPAFVKAGQQLSIRPDLVPPVVLAELSQLTDSVQPVPDEVAMKVLEEELGSKIDLLKDLKLVASASLGQVYKGKIKASNEVVAVKVQRPGMIKAFSLDLFLLQQWGVFMDSWTSVITHQKPYHKAFLQNFAAGGYGELDYQLEAQNQHAFQREMDMRSCPVVIPNVHDNLTTQRVLTTQWMDGIRLTDAPPETIRKLIPVGVELFLTQLLDVGAFHADPHPGNLLVTPDGKLCLLDFGLCAEVQQQEREAMTQAIVHLLARDFHSLVHDDAKQLGFLPHDYDTTELKPILTKILTGGLLEAGSNLQTRKRKLMEISNELNQVFFQYPFSVPPFLLW